MGFAIKTEIRSEGSTVTLVEGEQTELTCFARDLVPLPQLEIKLGKRDITGWFTENDVQV